MVWDKLSVKREDPECRAFIETVYLVAIADGEFEEVEMNDLSITVAQHPKMRQMTEREVSHILKRCHDALALEGLDIRIQAIARMLPDAHQRIDAISIAVACALADGQVEPEELVVLKHMQAAFGLSDKQVEQVISRYTS